MSVYYEVNEHLVVANTEEYGRIVDLMSSPLSVHGPCMLQDRAGIQNLTVIADGEEHRFSGDIISEDLHKAIRAMNTAKSLEVISSYHYHWYSDRLDPGPFEMTKLLQAVAKDAPEQLEGMFYSMYKNADCNAGAGCNTAFGRMDGKLYTGEIPFEAVESIPDGDWQASNAALVFDIEEMDGLDAEAIEAVCKELAAYGDADAPSDEDGMYSFALWNLRIRNAAQLKAFMQGCAKLIDLTDGECCLIGELADFSKPDVSLLHFDVEADGSAVLKLAAI